MSNIERISKKTFNLYTIGMPCPVAKFMYEELEWYANNTHTILGLVAKDKADQDFQYLIMARDETGQFRAGDKVEVSLKTIHEARNKLHESMMNVQGQNDPNFFIPQGKDLLYGDDLITPCEENRTLHPYFDTLVNNRLYSGAKKVVKEIGPWWIGSDHNSKQQFQYHQFDQRLWELYLFCCLKEMNCMVEHKESPDFSCEVFAPFDGKTYEYWCMSKLPFTMEATTVTASDRGVMAKYPDFNFRDQDNSSMSYEEFIHGYMAIKFGSALFSKLEKKSRNKYYWEQEHSRDKPFILAIADFHKNTDFPSMFYTRPALESYLYGLVRMKKESTPITEHTYLNKTIPSNFFNQPNAKNISAVLFSNAGTLDKFNRIGILAGSDESISFTRKGEVWNPDLQNLQNLCLSYPSIDYNERWADEIIMYHNPNANYLIPLTAFPNITHACLRNGVLRYYPPRSILFTNSLTIFQNN